MDHRRVRLFWETLNLCQFGLQNDILSQNNSKNNNNSIARLLKQFSQVILSLAAFYLPYS